MLATAPPNPSASIPQIPVLVPPDPSVSIPSPMLASLQPGAGGGDTVAVTSPMLQRVVPAPIATPEHDGDG